MSQLLNLNKRNLNEILKMILFNDNELINMIFIQSLECSIFTRLFERMKVGC